MRGHPILANKNNLGIYSLAWLTLISLQTLALVQLFHFTWLYAIVDGLVYGLLFYVFGIGYWFFIRFQDLENTNRLSLTIEQGTSIIVIVSIWVVSGIYILSAIFSENKEINNFLWESISWRYINGFLMYIVLILFYFLNSYYHHIQVKQKTENDLQRTLKDTEINLLRSKLNPHFLFNSLNSLYALIQTKPENASNMLLELSDYLRFSLNQDDKKMITLDEEDANLHRYLNIEKMRFGNKIQFTKEWSDKCKELKIPALILQPLMENAVKYGLQGNRDRVEICLKCQMKNQQLYLELSNTYDDKTALRKGAGMGMYTVKKRLEILFKQYHLFHVERKNTIFSVRLIIPQNVSLHE